MSATRGPPAEQATALVRDGRTYFAQGDVERARACYAAAVEIAPDDVIARAGLARCARLLAESLQPADDAHGFDSGGGGGALDLGADATVVDAMGAFLPEELERPPHPAPVAPHEPRGDPRVLGQPPIGSPPITALGSGAPPGPVFGPEPENRPEGREPGSPRYASGSHGHDPQVAHYPHYPAPGHGMPMAGVAVTARSTRFLIGVAIAIAASCTGLGVLIGFLAFGGAEDETAAAKTEATTTATRNQDVEEAEQAANSAVPAPAAARGGGAVTTGSLEARVKSIEHPVVAVAAAPVDGEVGRVHVKAGGSVTSGQKLYTLREGTGVRAAEVAVEAPAAGRIERRAARGDQVKKGDVLAQLVDMDVWHVVADVTSEEVSTRWACEVSSVEGRNRAPCRIEGVQRLTEQQSRATATVVAGTAGWLEGDEELIMAVSPPASVAQ